MIFKGLRMVRIVFSLLTLVIFSFLFIDFSATFSSGWINGITYLQLVPSLLKFLNLLAFSSLGFIAVLILSFLFGRVYCSFLCPLGALQDVFFFFSKRMYRKKKRMKYSRPHNTLRYGLLLAAAVPLFFGTALVLSLLDPYSVFGKIFSNLVRPVYYALNNFGALLSETTGNYWLFREPYKGSPLPATLFSGALLALVFILVWKKGRLYCNTVCPAGTFLGIVSRASLFRIRINRGLCTGCGICSSVCKAECIDPASRRIDYSRCVVCFDCLQVCPHDGVGFTASPLKIPDSRVTEETEARRSFLKTGLALPAALFLFLRKGVASVPVEGKIPVVKKFPVCPPGSFSIARFTERCTACYLCVSACPTRVLQPSFLEYGWAGFMLPFMDYKTSFCNFECTLCGEICPTGAILPLESGIKKLTQLGKAHFIKENCIVYTDEKDCGACSEHCPTKAVNMVHYKSNLTIPEVNEDICIGCGACEYACPTVPKSIYVDGNEVHVEAKKPEIEKMKIEVDHQEDFPF
ncbi:MAG: 4Fe-4S binding protein [Bacteroidales bacterium]|nr:4Fe-4S binding protein [Bacteroidales bacterium]